MLLKTKVPERRDLAKCKNKSSSAGGTGSLSINIKKVLNVVTVQGYD